MKKILGERLKNEREKRKLSRPALGQLAGGVPTSTIQGIEEGKYDVTLANFAALADGLDVSVGSLLEGLTKHDRAAATPRPISPPEALQVLARAIEAPAAQDPLMKEFAELLKTDRKGAEEMLKVLAKPSEFSKRGEAQEETKRGSK